MKWEQIIFFLNDCVPKLVCIAMALVVFILSVELYKYIKNNCSKELKSGTRKTARGIIFGKKGKKYVYSPEKSEGSVAVVAQSGAGKTSAILIPTIRSLVDTNSFIIDISSDIESNCSNIRNKLVFSPENADTTAFNIFGAIDVLNDIESKYEALEKLAFLLMPSNFSSDTEKFFQENGRKILTGTLVAFWDELDFVEITEKIIENNCEELFKEIEATGKKEAIRYIQAFSKTNSANTSGCKQNVDNAIGIYARNSKIKRAIHRPKNGEQVIEPKSIETHTIIYKISEDLLSLYAPLTNIMTSQIMQYISTRKVTAKSKNLLIALDELGSLRIEKELLLDSVRRFRKRKCKLLILIQSISDLRILYGEEVTKAILANIKYKVLLSGLGIPEEQRYFAELIGHENNEWKIEPADLDRQGKNTVILIASDEPGGYLKLKKNYFFK